MGINITAILQMMEWKLREFHSIIHPFNNFNFGPKCVLVAGNTKMKKT